ncbi:hypothetical protein FXO38_13102 [Capsicum annuum]|nr:hypothetical protein FXO37_21648 [Capsicum annuum]KAF3658603.1 hypothetical protein FXO38_13102 [Capsicum annuum]
MSINVKKEEEELTGEIVLQCQMGNKFIYFRKTMKDENIDGLFKKSYFGRFLELDEDVHACFPMRMVYGLLKRRIKYVRDDKNLEEGGIKIDEIWINYYGIQICFGLQEFAIVTGLIFHYPEELPIAKGTACKRSKVIKYKEKIDGLFDIA